MGLAETQSAADSTAFAVNSACNQRRFRGKVALLPGQWDHNRDIPRWGLEHCAKIDAPKRGFSPCLAVHPAQKPFILYFLVKTFSSLAD
jgi:hypothetical protein